MFEGSGFLVALFFFLSGLRIDIYSTFSDLRGILGAMSQFHIVMGILVSLLLAFPFATPTRWRFFIGITAIPPFIQLVFSRFVVESPRLLLMKGQHKKACESLRYLRGPTADTEEEISLIVTSSQKEASTGQGGVLMNLQSHKVGFILCISRLPYYYHPLLDIDFSIGKIWINGWYVPSFGSATLRHQCCILLQVWSPYH